MCFSKKSSQKNFQKITRGHSASTGEHSGVPGRQVLGGTRGHSGNTWEYSGHSGSSWEYSGVLVFQIIFFSKNYENYFFRKLFLSKKLFFQRNNIFKKISLHIFSKKIVLKNYFSEKLLRQFFFPKYLFSGKFQKKYRKKSDFKQNLTIFFQKKGFQTTFFSKNFQ